MQAEQVRMNKGGQPLRWFWWYKKEEKKMAPIIFYTMNFITDEDILILMSQVHTVHTVEYLQTRNIWKCRLTMIVFLCARLRIKNCQAFYERQTIFTWDTTNDVSRVNQWLTFLVDMGFIMEKYRQQYEEMLLSYKRISC